MQSTIGRKIILWFLYSHESIEFFDALNVRAGTRDFKF